MFLLLFAFCFWFYLICTVRCAFVFCFPPFFVCALSFATSTFTCIIDVNVLTLNMHVLKWVIAPTRYSTYQVLGLTFGLFFSLLFSCIAAGLLDYVVLKARLMFYCVNIRLFSSPLFPCCSTCQKCVWPMRAVCLPSGAAKLRERIPEYDLGHDAACWLYDYKNNYNNT